LVEAVRCEGLTKRYGRVEALNRLDLTVASGAIYGFLGPNGAGKTTTLKLLTGLGRATGGSAWVAGQRVAPNSIALQRKIGFLPEEPAFYGWMTGRESLAFLGGLFGLPSKETASRGAELLELVDLTDAAGRRVGGYSRGMRQRLGIAQALINRPEVLFLDEPCSALDPLGRAEVLDTIARLRERATTVFMSTHILADVERVCDVVGIIDRGSMVVESGVDELRRRFARPAFEIEFEQPADSFLAALESQAWVEKAEAEAADGLFRVTVSANDVERAKRELPQLVAATGLPLRQFQSVLPTLEDIFVELVGRRGG
jgi:ABC-2 type transport system ATP-binding protein